MAALACLQRAMPFGLELAEGWPKVGRRLSAARYAHWPWYDVLRSTFYVLAEEGAAVLAGPSPLPYYRVLIIYIS